MKNNYFHAYKINVKYEFATYKNVGRDYGNHKEANLGIVLNLRRFFRKRITNKNEKKYNFNNTYSEWKRHVKNVFPLGICNLEDMLHWLFLEKRREESLLEAIKAILIPIYIVLIQIEQSVLSQYQIGPIEMLTIMTVLLLIVMFLSTKVLVKTKEKICFYADLIEIVSEEIHNRQC